jgi:hypothetical protein
MFDCVSKWNRPLEYGFNLLMLFLWLAGASLLSAQQAGGPLPAQSHDLALNSVFPLTYSEPSAAPGDAQAPAGGTSSAAVAHDGWHFAVTPYLWFAGAHGTVGVLGHTTSVHASAGDLLSHLDIGLMGAADARYKRFVMFGDMMWLRISDDKAQPIGELGTVSADVRVGQFVWTSNFGYRVLDKQKIKTDASIGVRYWHLGQKLNLAGPSRSDTFNGSQDWADIVIGGRVQVPIAEKWNINLIGDVGGWNATAKLDYQFAPLLAYQLKPKWTLLAGYRYLFIDYRGDNSSINNLVSSGALMGVTYHIK